ncbi:hypothetical protein MBANPS3_008102 [Mucor bainieri]
MSCHSCGGCFTGAGCSTIKLSKKEALNDSARFQSLLDLAATQQQQPQQKEHDHVVPTIMSELSKNVYASQTVLFKAFDDLELDQFLSLAKCLYTANIVGVHIAWAAEYFKGDVKELLRILSTGDKEEQALLLQHCDDSAEMHEMFGQLATGSIGRVGSHNLMVEFLSLYYNKHGSFVILLDIVNGSSGIGIFNGRFLEQCGLDSFDMPSSPIYQATPKEVPRIYAPRINTKEAHT